MRTKWVATGLAGALLCVASIFWANEASTQNTPPAKVDCKVADCAKLMVEIANKLMAQNEQNNKRLASVESEIEKVKQSINTAKADLQTEINGLVSVAPTTVNKTVPTQKDDTGRLASEGAASFPLRCDDGQVAVGIDLLLGGTCHEQCNGDGRPVQQFKIVCRPLQITKSIASRR